MIIDFHTHIFPEIIRKNRNDFFEGEPAFSLLYDSKKSKLAGADDIVPVMREEGVDISVVFGFPWKNPDTAKMHNDYIIASVEKYPDQLKGFCCVDPAWNGTAGEVERCLAAGINVPILPGVMPIYSVKMMYMLAELCGATIVDEIKQGCLPGPVGSDN